MFSFLEFSVWSHVSFLHTEKTQEWPRSSAAMHRMLLLIHAGSMGACRYEITLWVRGWIIVYRSQSEVRADVGVFKNPFWNSKRGSRHCFQTRVHSGRHTLCNELWKHVLGACEFQCVWTSRAGKPPNKEVLAPALGPLSRVALWGPCTLVTEVHEDPRNFSLGFNLQTPFWATWPQTGQTGKSAGGDSWWSSDRMHLSMQGTCIWSLVQN